MLSAKASAAFTAPDYRRQSELAMNGLLCCGPQMAAIIRRAIRANATGPLLTQLINSSTEMHSSSLHYV
jgi:hypothetical protein